MIQCKTFNVIGNSIVIIHSSMDLGITLAPMSLVAKKKKLNYVHKNYIGLEKYTHVARDQICGKFKEYCIISNSLKLD